jgi:Iron-sulfur cluster-binding domain/Radical SAM superfamily
MSLPGRDWKQRWTQAARSARISLRYFASFCQWHRAPKVPVLHIQGTNLCNSNCVFCPNSRMQRKKEPLPLELFRKSVDEAVALGVTEINFSMNIGDPLLDPHFLERARYVSQFPQIREIGFNTTLQWLHKLNLEEFFQCRFQWICVSTSLSGREKYREFFGVDKYDQMLANLIALLTENNRRGNPILVDIRIKPTNEPVQNMLDHPDFKRIGALTSQDLVKDIDRDFFVDDWSGAVQLPAYLHLPPLLPRAFRPCCHLYEGLEVYSNGKIGLCLCRDYEATSELIVGHVASDEIGQVWNGPKVQQVRSDWARKNKIPGICKDCRLYWY